VPGAAGKQHYALGKNGKAEKGKGKGKGESNSELMVRDFTFNLHP
jgi:hypothetical protein